MASGHRARSLPRGAGSGTLRSGTPYAQRDNLQEDSTQETGVPSTLPLQQQQQKPSLVLIVSGV
jgi:hypothetical protein